MKELAISVTEAARNFSDCVNRVRYQKAHFALLKNGEPVARLAPYEEKRCTGADLAKALRGAELSQAEAREWKRDLKAARKTLGPPMDKWQ